MLGPFICCKRTITVDPPGEGSNRWGVNGGPDEGLSQSQMEQAVNNFINNPDEWTPADNPPSPVGPWTVWKRDAEFCGDKFNGWL